MCAFPLIANVTVQDYHMERLVRDLRVHQILEGTSEIMNHIVGRALVA
jgi:butyryl-CoA dehydrogenase